MTYQRPPLATLSLCGLVLFAGCSPHEPVTGTQPEPTVLEGAQDHQGPAASAATGGAPVNARTTAAATVRLLGTWRSSGDEITVTGASPEEALALRSGLGAVMVTDTYNADGTYVSEQMIGGHPLNIMGTWEVLSSNDDGVSVLTRVDGGPVTNTLTWGDEDTYNVVIPQGAITVTIPFHRR